MTSPSPAILGQLAEDWAVRNQDSAVYDLVAPARISRWSGHYESATHLGLGMPMRRAL